MVSLYIITALRKEARAELKKHPDDFNGFLSNAAEFVYFRAMREDRIGLIPKQNRKEFHHVHHQTARHQAESLYV